MPRNTAGEDVLQPSRNKDIISRKRTKRELRIPMCEEAGYSDTMLAQVLGMILNKIHVTPAQGSYLSVKSEQEGACAVHHASTGLRPKNRYVEVANRCA